MRLLSEEEEIVWKMRLFGGKCLLLSVIQVDGGFIFNMASHGNVEDVGFLESWPS